MDKQCKSYYLDYVIYTFEQYQLLRKGKETKLLNLQRFIIVIKQNKVKNICKIEEGTKTAKSSTNELNVHKKSC